MDQVDRLILTEVQRDGRISIADLADKVGLSSAPVYRRLRSLEKQGIVLGYHAELNTDSLGLSTCAIVGVRCATHEAGAADALEAFAVQSGNVIRCDNVAGEFDYVLVVLAKTLADYEKFTKALRSVPGVSHLHSQISLRNIKANQLIDLAQV